jgi:gliding motility-associated-like protein
VKNQSNLCHPCAIKRQLKNINMKYLKILLLFSLCSYAQNETSNWFFGANAGIRFMPDGSTQPLAGGQITYTPNSNQIEGCSTISDSNGQLLLYTDGRTVWDRNHLPMPNGSMANNTRLNGHILSTQSALIIPHPTNSMLYYIFTTDEPMNWNVSFYPNINPQVSYNFDDGLNNGLCYSIVDLSVMGNNGSIGDVIQRNVHLITYNPDPSGLEIKYKCSEKLAGVKNQNNNTYWVLTQFIDKYYAFQITATGVVHTPIISTIGYINNTFLEGFGSGQIKFNKEGNKIASSFPSKLELLDFNIITGEVSNPKLVNNSPTYSIEFSSSGQYLYLPRGQWPELNTIRQYNLNSINIPSNYVDIITPYGVGQLQIGNNNKIYGAEISGNFLTVIHNPDALGLACNLLQNNMQLPPNTDAGVNLPNFVVGLTQTNIQANPFCLGLPTQFSIQNGSNAQNISWQFGDGATSTLANPSHTYASAGTYNVTLTYTVNGVPKNQNRTITIYAIPTATAIGLQKLCIQTSPQNINLKTTYDALLLNGQDPTQVQVTYFATPENLNQNIPIATPENYAINANATVTIFAKIQNKQNNSCFVTTSFDIQTYLQPTTGTQAPIVICQNPYTGQHTFNLQDYSNVLTQNNALLTVNYYATQNHADTNTNALPNTYTNTLAQETIYYRIHHLQNTNCYVTGTLQLMVDPMPQPVNLPIQYICDTDTDGVVTNNLAQNNTALLNGFNPTKYLVTYYLNSTDANNGLNAINPIFNNTQVTTTIHYRITHTMSNSCFTTGSFTLVVTPHTVVNQPATQYYCVQNTTTPISFNLPDFYPMLLQVTNYQDYVISFHPTLLAAQNQSQAFASPYQNTQLQETWHVRISPLANPNCVYYTTISINIQPEAVAYATPPLTTCDNNNQTGIASFDLSVLIPQVLQNQPIVDYQVSFYASLTNAQAGISALLMNYTNTSNPQTIYAKVNNINSTNCYDIEAITLAVHPKPYIDEIVTKVMCENTTITLDVAQGFVSYLWNTGATQHSIPVNTAGQYWVEVEKAYPTTTCKGRLYFDVKSSSKATIIRIDKIDFAGLNNQLSILATGLGEYEYSIDGSNYQDSNVFIGLNAGYYTVYVRDKKECGIVTKTIALQDYPKFFTPNGDSYNDSWHIIGSRFDRDLQVKILDRYGKLLTTLKGGSSGWDGTYNGVQMPADDYWFVVERTDEPVVKGHFSLKR